MTLYWMGEGGGGGGGGDGKVSGEGGGGGGGGAGGPDRVAFVCAGAAADCFKAR